MILPIQRDDEDSDKKVEDPEAFDRRLASQMPSIFLVKQGDAHTLKLAIELRTDINDCDKNGMTALHHAAALGARPCIRILVACGKCDYLIRDNEGRYASDLAIEWARDYAVGRLLSKHQLRQARERGVPAWVPPDRS